MSRFLHDVIRCLIAQMADRQRNGDRSTRADALAETIKMKRTYPMNKTNQKALDAMIQLYSTPSVKKPSKKPSKPAKAADAAAKRKPVSNRQRNRVFSNIVGTAKGRAMDESYPLSLGKKPNEVANALRGL